MIRNSRIDPFGLIYATVLPLVMVPVMSIGKKNKILVERPSQDRNHHQRIN